MKNNDEIATALDSQKKKIKNGITNIYTFMIKNNANTLLFLSFLFLRSCLGGTCSGVYSRHS